MSGTPAGVQENGPARTSVAWRALAHSLAALHVTYVLFVVFGGLLILVSPRFLPAHLVAVVWAAGTMLCDLGCPVTTWEKTALRRSGYEPYTEGFLQHHVLRSRFEPAKARRAHVVLGIAMLVLNAAIYYLVLDP